MTKIVVNKEELLGFFKEIKVTVEDTSKDLIISGHTNDSGDIYEIGYQTLESLLGAL